MSRSETIGKTRVEYKPKARVLPLNGAKWRKLRAEVLADHPLCVHCLEDGRFVKATDVDHIENHTGDYSDDNSRENLMPLCHDHHSIKTAAEMGKQVKHGCDANGMPRDPNHHWNR